MEAAAAGLFGADVAMNVSSESRYSALALGLWGRGDMGMGTPPVYINQPRGI